MHRLTVDSEADRVVQRRANENREEANWERTRGGEIEAGGLSVHASIYVCARTEIRRESINLLLCVTSRPRMGQVLWLSVQSHGPIHMSIQYI